jgi:hypothetical protein
MLQLLERIFPKAKKKARRSGKSAPGGSKDGQGTRLSSDWPILRSRLDELGARQLIVHGDVAGLAAAKAELPGMNLLWASHLPGDMAAGAKCAEDLEWRSADAAVCIGSDLPTRYRQSIRLMAATDAKKPVFWIGSGFEYCGGTLSAPREADEVEGLLYNHFQEFFGIKDALQFRIEIYHGPEVKRYYRILDPNQSHVIRLSDHFPKREHPVSLAAFVEHPILTRDRHYRLRLCADVFWKDSITTLHSAHEFSRSPEHKVEFRLPAWYVRDGQMALTLPNFERNASTTHDVEAIAGGTGTKTSRNTSLYIDQSTLQRDGIGDEAMFGWRYRGFGGSNWFTLEGAGALGSNHRGNIAGNHHATCPVLDRSDFQAEATELDRYRQLEANGLILQPHPVPVTGAESELAFAYDSDSANPAQPHLRIDFFDASGAHLGHFKLTKEKPGPLFADDMVRLWNDPKGAAATLALVSFDWAKGGLRYQGFKPQVNLMVRNRRTLDQDFTEFQSCWRNLGAAVPGFPHWLTEQLGVVGRTNVFGRVRCDKDLRTSVLVVNGSGRLNYRRAARIDIIVINNAGARIQERATVPAFTWRMLDLDQMFPSLARHLGESGNGALLLQSGDADVNAQIVTTSPQGAVALQHLWGY